MKYIEQVNSALLSAITENPGVVIFGQNVSAGSRISGLTRGLAEAPGCHSLNTPNCENSLVGVGFGLMLNGVSSIFFMKQLDFLLLGIDQIVNSYNMIRTTEPKASFTIVPVVVDIPYQGGQSSLNNLDDFCSIARVDGFSVTSGHDAETIIARNLLSPGFRIITVSQRMFGTDTAAYDEPEEKGSDGAWFRYHRGDDVTIVCFNFSLPQGMALRAQLKERGVNASLYSVNNSGMAVCPEALVDAERTGALITLDDSKSLNRSATAFVIAAHENERIRLISTTTRSFTDEWFGPNQERLVVDYDALCEKIASRALS